MSEVPAGPPLPSDPPDGVSRSAPPTPTATLIALAAAGRGPTDLTLPTAGSEGVDPPDEGSHEVAAEDELSPGTHRKNRWLGVRSMSR